MTVLTARDRISVVGGQQIAREETPKDGLNQAEGYRYLTRLLRNALESVIEGGSPEYPVMRGLGNMVKLGADNPDNLYMGATIRGDLRDVALSLTNERMALKPGSAVNRHFLEAAEAIRI